MINGFGVIQNRIDEVAGYQKNSNEDQKMSKKEKCCEDHFPIVYNTQGDTQQPIYQLANYEGDTQQPIFQLANYDVCSAELSDND